MWYLWYCGTYINKWLYDAIFYVPQMFHSCSTISFRSKIVEHFFSKWRSDAKFNFCTKKPFLSRVSTCWVGGHGGKGAMVWLAMGAEPCWSASRRTFGFLLVAVKNIAFNSETTGAYFAEPLFDGRQWCPSPFFDCISGREKTVGN